MEFTVANIALAFSTVASAWVVVKAILKVVAPSTQTTADNAALAAMESAEARLKQLEESE